MVDQVIKTAIANKEDDWKISNVVESSTPWTYGVVTLNPDWSDIVSSLVGLDIPEHDYIALSYTWDNLTWVVYKSWGAGWSTVATLTLSYTGSVLDSITKT